MATTKVLRKRAREKFWRRYKGPMKCFYCKRTVSRYMLDGDDLKATVDHVKSLSKNGTSKFENLVLSCFNCNQKKGCK